MRSSASKFRAIIDLVWAEVRGSVRSYFSPVRAVVADIAQAVRQTPNCDATGRPTGKHDSHAARAR
jgi:hypothetical protein